MSSNGAKNNHNGTARSKKIWIDLDNSPHVPFFKPIIEELEKRSYSVLVTARDCFQVCELADLLKVRYKAIGHHYGRHTLAKLAGLAIRSLQLMPTILRERPDLCISHGSRSLFLLSSLLHIPSITIFDYEHAKWVGFVRPSWLMIPDIISDDAVSVIGIERKRVLRYPGIKEDVYAPSFRPDPSIREQLRTSPGDIVVTVRPPATEAHYHNPDSEILLNAVLDFLGHQPHTRAIVLPRTPKQEVDLRQSWPDLFASGKIQIPDHVVDGMDLIWFSDLVISGGGTMNREAAALGVPVYSIFRGKLGAVDKYLSDTGRLTLIATPDEVRSRIALVHRDSSLQRKPGERQALQVIVENIVAVAECGGQHAPGSDSHTASADREDKGVAAMSHHAGRL